MEMKPAAHAEITFIRIVAVVTCATILFATWVFWDIRFSGFLSNSYTHQVEEVVPGSSADRAGLRVGDTIMSLYGRPMADVLHSIQIVTWIPPRPQPIPMVVERAGTQLTLALDQRTDDWSLQAYKAAVAVLALTCWITGYLLGVVRRHTAPHSVFVPLFWMGIGGVFGCVPLVQYTSTPLLVVVVWLLVTVFMPLLMYIHVWFPSRPVSPTTARRAITMLAAVSLVLNVGIAVVAVGFRIPLLLLLDGLFVMLPLALLASLSGSAWLLYRAERQARDAHFKRQLRLIILACVAVPLLWLLLTGVPTLLSIEDIAGNTLKALACTLVPVADLVGGIGTNLDLWIRVAMRSFLHLITLTGIVTALAVLVTYLPMDNTTTALWGALGCVALYRPIFQGVHHVVPGTAMLRREYRALDAASTQLAQTLDPEALVATLVTGLYKEFSAPAYAIYVGDIDGTNTLSLWTHERIEGLPHVITRGSLTHVLCSEAFVLESRTIQRSVWHAPLTPEEEQVLNNLAVAIWCSIRHSQGHMLGVVLLGMRGDLDPYTAFDLRALQQLMSAASLAFTNSAAYSQQRVSEELIHKLYQQTQEARDAAISEVARDLHDELIPVPVLNIQALERMASSITDPMLHEEIALLLQSEHTVITMLRSICTQLRPPGIDDPCGLPGVLRDQACQLGARWSGTCDVLVTGPQEPIAPHIQWEAFRITREALHNAVKHANATQICIHLQFPVRPSDLLRLTISDNGQNTHEIQVKPNHWGILYMRESARSAGGSLDIQR